MNDLINFVGDPATHAALLKLQGQVYQCADGIDKLTTALTLLGKVTESLGATLQNQGKHLLELQEQVVALSKLAVEANTKDQPLQ